MAVDKISKGREVVVKRCPCGNPIKVMKVVLEAKHSRIITNLCYSCFERKYKHG